MPQLPYYPIAKIGDPPMSGGRRADANDFGPDYSEIARNVQGVASYMLERTEGAETREALIANAEIRAKYAKELDDAQTSGAPLEPIRERMQADLQKVGEKFQTKKGANAIRLYAAQNDHMFHEQANRINVVRAAQNAQVDGMRFLQAAGAVLRANPDYLKSALQDADNFAASLAGVAPEKKALIAQQLKEELNLAAVMASARLNPEETITKLEGGAWDLDPQKREAAITRARQELEHRRTAERIAKQEEKEAKHERAEKARDDWFKQIVAGKPTKAIGQGILDDPNLTAVQREHLFTFMERRAKEKRGEGGADELSKRNLWLRIHAPDDDVNKIWNADAIYEAVKKGTIKTGTAQWLLGQVEAAKDANGRSIGGKLAGVSRQFERAVNSDPRMLRFTADERAQIVNEYTYAVLEKTNELRAQNKNPNSVFDPNDTSYVGKREFMQTFIDKVASEKRDRVRGATGGGIPAPKTQAEYDALPKGTVYLDTDGKQKRKETDATNAGTAKGGAVSGTIRR